MNKQQISDFYKAYRKKCLSEVREHYGNLLPGFEKLDKNKYRVYDEDAQISATFTFKNQYGSDLERLPAIVDRKLVTHYVEVVVDFDDSMPEENKITKNFLRVIGTSPKVLIDYLEINSNIKVLYFSAAKKGHQSLYSGSSMELLKTYFSEQYDIVPDNDRANFFIINKSVIDVKDHRGIQKLSESTSFMDALVYWKYPHLHPSTPANVKIKNKIKQRVIKNIFN
jgi:hypothetical protein